ncbi:MAG: hypothetical protein SFZ23_14890 [Planctomycetota bacterium]|nr:hypothetical protein [Planctomycetota bacterium]
MSIGSSRLFASITVSGFCSASIVPALAGATLGALVLESAAKAQVTFYVNQAEFDATGPTTLVADFEEFTPGQRLANPSNLGEFTLENQGGDIVIVGLGRPGDTNPFPVSDGISSNGNEDFVITFSSPFVQAVGFSTLTNRFNPVRLTVFGESNEEIASYVLPQAPNTFGFVGFVSSAPISGFRWLTDRGGEQNTVIDNIRTRVPSPSAAAVLGLGGLLAARRRR